MTKIFEVILRLLSRHFAFLRIYRAYLQRTRRTTSTENLLCPRISDSKTLDIKRKHSECVIRNREYHSAEDERYCRCYHKRKLSVGLQSAGITGGNTDLVMGEWVMNTNFRIITHQHASRTTYHCVTDDNDNVAVQHQDLVNADFHVEGLIGSGGFGSVFVGKYCGQRVAVKALRPRRTNAAAMLQSFRAEVNALYLKHENIVNVLATSAVEDFEAGAFIIMEYAGKRNLQQLINDQSEQLPLPRRAKFALHIIRALQHTHAHGIAHLDIKPANVIVDDEDICRLGDYGCSQQVFGSEEKGLRSPTNRSYLTGTCGYRAPELLCGGAPTTKADIYSYGISLWQMLTRETPYAGENHHVVIFGVVANDMRPKFPDNHNENDWYRRLIVESWTKQPEERPTARDILKQLETRLGCDDNA
ncbi:serine/threonine-protein kinase mos-like [Diadema setosum]|uniref:serine/threonine-protein kinase mos-like n=1 Tax=Diadema setosum TaxID=31175 RepID=UPI003B3BD08B